MLGIVGAAVVIGASALSGMLSFGTYGYFKDKGMSPWKAGAATGAISGLIGAVGFLGLGLGAKFDAWRTRGLAGLTIEEIPSSMAGLTISQLSGIPQINGMGMTLDDLQLGALTVDPLGYIDDIQVAGSPCFGAMNQIEVY